MNHVKLCRLISWELSLHYVALFESGEVWRVVVPRALSNEEAQIACELMREHLSPRTCQGEFDAWVTVGGELVRFPYDVCSPGLFEFLIQDGWACSSSEHPDPDITSETKLWTDYPITELGDKPDVEAPVRECRIVGHERLPYVVVDVEGVRACFKGGYIYTEPGRCGDVPSLEWSDVLAICGKTLA